jgi:hypothetical protein
MRPLGPAHPRLLSRSVIVLIALALAMAGCSARAFQGDVAEVISATGLQVRSGGGWEHLEAGDSIPDGATLRTDVAEARLRLDEAQVWLGPGATVVLDGVEVGLERGEVLVDDPNGGLVTVWGDLTVAGTATYRLGAGAAPRVGVYRGEAEVTRTGESRTVGALREVGLSVRRLPAGAPLAYRAQDPWDRALLAGAISFDDEIERLRRGIDRRYGTDPRPAAFYETFVAVSRPMVPTLLSAARIRLADERFGPPSDALITLFVAQAAGEQRDAPLRNLAEQITSLRRAGARWGLIAEEFGITPTRLAATVDLGEERRVALAPDEDAQPAQDAAGGAGGSTASAGATGTAAQPGSGGSGATSPAAPGQPSGGAAGSPDGGSDESPATPSAPLPSAPAPPPAPTPIPAPVPSAPRPPSAPSAPSAPSGPSAPAPEPAPGLIEQTVSTVVTNGNGKGPAQLPDQARAGQPKNEPSTRQGGQPEERMKASSAPEGGAEKQETKDKEQPAGAPARADR